MSGSEVNWWSGKGPTNPQSEVPLANQIGIEQTKQEEVKSGENYFDGLDFVIEHPGFDILFNPEGEMPERHSLYATFKGDMSLPNEKDEKERVYMVWERNSDIPMAVTTRPSRYTDEVRNIS